MPGAGDVGKAFGLKKGPLITEVGSDEAASVPSPKEKLTKSLGAEARELLTGGVDDDVSAATEPTTKKSGMLIQEVEPAQKPREQPRKMIISLPSR